MDLKKFSGRATKKTFFAASLKYLYIEDFGTIKTHVLHAVLTKCLALRAACNGPKRQGSSQDVKIHLETGR